MFVSHEDTYYSEYIVMKEALEASGYSVDVRSADKLDFTTYMLPAGTDIVQTANSLSSSSYTQFQQQFAALFGSAWDETKNTTPVSLPTNGPIGNIQDMSEYVGLVVVGGTGVVDYRLDGSYTSQGVGNRLIPAYDIEEIAEKLNSLAIDALKAGKTVMAQCHGASLPVFWRVPETSGAGVEALGFSLLKDGIATGYPEAATPATLNDFGVTHRANDRVTISSPHSSLNDSSSGDFRIITTRDWYPQTVAHAAQTFINTIETYPTIARQSNPLSVLIIHGGEIIEGNCGAGNRNNDIPCNYGEGANTPADYVDLIAALENNDSTDGFDINTSEVNITSNSLPFDKTLTSSTLNYLEAFDAIVFYKHWSTGLTDEFLEAIVDYADNGGGVIALHHGLYNDIDGMQNKDTLITLFGAQSSASGWSAKLTNYNLHSTNYGHFISTFGIEYDAAADTPAAWAANQLPTEANSAYSYLPTLAIEDEIYNNMAFEPGTTFGRGTNEITTLFSNDITPAGQCHTSAFTRLVDFDEDGQIGKVFFIQVGERTANYSSDSMYYRIIRNATIWAGAQKLDQIIELDSATSKQQGGGSFYLPEFASSGLKISYESSNTGVATLTDNLVTPLAPGTTTITASQPGDYNFNAADEVEQILTVDTTFIWNGSNWNYDTIPSNRHDVKILLDFDFSIHGSFASNNLEVQEKATLTINSSNSLVVNGDLINDGTIHVTSGASLITLGSVSGNDFQIDRVTTFDQNTGSYSVIGSPVQNTDFSMLGSNALVYGYDESEVYNPNGNEGLNRFKTPGELLQTTLSTGQGYFSAYTGDSQGKISFTGTPNTGTIEVPLQYTDQGISEEIVFEGYNLVSNPYPSAISYAALMAANSSADINESIYIWDDNDSSADRGSNADYLTINILGNTNSQNNGESKWDGNIRSGQGFFVKANSETTLRFNDSMRIQTNNTDEGFFRVSNINSIKLLLTDGNNRKATVLGFIEGATTGMDNAYDATKISGGNLQLYSIQANGEYQLAIQGLPSLYSNEVQLGYNTVQNQLLTLSLIEGDEVETVFLKDRLTGAIVDLKKETYAFTTTPGENNSRFSIQLHGENTHSLSSLLSNIYSYAEDNTLHVVFKGFPYDTKPGKVSFSIKALNGKERLHAQERLHSNHWEVSTGGFPEGIYILSIESDKGIWQKKIIID